jgi:hypothetical protein
VLPIEMLLGTTNALVLGLCQNGILANALIEAFTLHARVLLAFLYSEKARKDDVIADDYVANWTCGRPSMPEPLKLIQGRVGKEVAHLTYGRLSLSEEAKQWPIIELSREMCALVGKFLELVPEEKLGSLVLNIKSVWK